MAAFQSGQRLTPAVLNTNTNAGASAVEIESVTFGTTTSTTYVTALTTAGTLGVAFVAPPSGKVTIHWGTHIGNTALGGNSYATIHVRTGSSVGSGTDVLTAADVRAIRNQSSTATDQDTSGQNRSKTVAGLTPGNSYNVTMDSRVTAGTGAYENRNIQVVPTL